MFCEICCPIYLIFQLWLEACLWITGSRRPASQRVPDPVRTKCDFIFGLNLLRFGTSVINPTQPKWQKQIKLYQTNQKDTRQILKHWNWRQKRSYLIVSETSRSPRWWPLIGGPDGGPWWWPLMVALMVAPMVAPMVVLMVVPIVALMVALMVVRHKHNNVAHLWSNPSIPETYHEQGQIWQLQNPMWATWCDKRCDNWRFSIMILQARDQFYSQMNHMWLYEERQLWNISMIGVISDI